MFVLVTFAALINELVSGSKSRAATDLPQHLDQHDHTTSAMPNGTHNDTNSSLYVLLSFPYYSRGSRLYQPHITNIRTDRSFFNLLQENFIAARSRFKRIVSLKAIKSVKFVQLETLRTSNLVDIRKIDDLPPQADEHYVYDPKPPELIPPIGENLMVHLLAHPDHADEFSALLMKRIPRRNRALLPCPVKGTGLGWGIHFALGYHYGLLWLGFLLLVLIGSIVFVVCWGILQHDVQGASGVAGYALVLATAVGGSLQAWAEMDLI